MIRQAGYLGIRSVELLSLDFPRPMGSHVRSLERGLLMLPTTLQAYPHGLLAYAKNIIRRGAVPTSRG